MERKVVFFPFHVTLRVPLQLFASIDLHNPSQNLTTTTMIECTLMIAPGLYLNTVY